MKYFVIFLLIFNLEAHAGFKVGNSAVACAAGNSGSLRYNSSSKKLEVCKSSSWQSVSASAIVPTNMVAYFTGTCPVGWSEYTSARGRYMVGLPSGGTLAGTVGTALTNLQNRDTGYHRHTVNPASANTNTTGNHTHTAVGSGSTAGAHEMGQRLNGSGAIGSGYTNYVAHTHTINIANTNTSYYGSSAGTHAPYRQLRPCKKN